MKRFALSGLWLAYAAAAAAAPSANESRAHAPLIQPTVSNAELTSRDTANARRSGFAQLDLSSIRAPRTETTTPLELISGGSVEIEPFPGDRFEFDGRSLDQAQDGMLSWIGVPSNGEHGLFVLTVSGDRAYAMLEVGLRRFILEADGTDEVGIVRVKEVDPASYPGCGTDDHGEAVLGKEHAWAPAPKTQPLNDRTLEATVQYTPAVAANHGGDPSVLINNLGASFNAALNASSITGSFRVVHYTEFNHTETFPYSGGDFYSDREAMRSGASSPWSSIHADRDTYRADVAVLLVDHDALGNDPGVGAVCGIGVRGLYDYEGFGYALLSDGCASGDLTFIHEIGHTLGGRHDWSEDTTADEWPANNRGYTNDTVGFHTIMGSRTAGAASCVFGSGCPRLSRFSTPNQQVNIGGTNYALGLVDDNPGTAGNQPNEEQGGFNGTSIPAAATWRMTGDPAPGQPASMLVDRLCSGNNELSWPAPSGSVGWYEVASFTNSSYTVGEVEVYRGGTQSFIYNVSGTRWVRVRACNAEGCGSWRNGNQSATVGCP